MMRKLIIWWWIHLVAMRRFYEIYGNDHDLLKMVGFVEQLVAIHSDQFESQLSAVRTIFSGIEVNHLSIVIEWDRMNITIREGNIDGNANMFIIVNKGW